MKVIKRGLGDIIFLTNTTTMYMAKCTKKTKKKNNYKVYILKK